MTNDQDNEFSWSTCFMTTGLSLLVFGAVLDFLNDRFDTYFWYAGAAAITAGILTWAANFDSKNPSSTINSK